MSFWDDRRGQAGLVGAVLLFGILVISLATYQGFIVPQENKQVEFNDYQQVNADLLRAHETILDTAYRGSTNTVPIHTGSRYPSRVIAVNPPPAEGRLAATSPGEIRVTNAKAVSSERVNTRKYWDGSPKSFATKELVFSPSYNQLTGDELVVTGYAVYRNASAGVVTQSGQSLVQGDTVNLVLLSGNLSTGGVTTPLTVEPVSTATRRVTVTGNGGPINITLPTRAPADEWADTVGTSVERNPNVDVTVVGPHAVNVTLAAGQSFDLRIAKVELKQESAASVVPRPGPKYIVATDGDNQTIATGGNTSLTAEVRDRYNNPVSGRDVQFATSDGTLAPPGPAVVTTDNDGQARVLFDPAGNGTRQVTATVLGPPGSPLNQTTFNLVSLSGISGNGFDVGQSINPHDANDVILKSADVKQDAASNYYVDVVLQNTNPDKDQTLDDMRFNFYLLGTQSSDTNNYVAPGSLRLNDPNTGTVVPNRGPYTSVSAEGITVPANNGTESFRVYLYTSTDGSGDPLGDGNANKEPPHEGDFFVLSARYDSGRNAIYFVAPAE